MTLFESDHLETGLDYIRSAPKDQGTLAMIVARPAEGQREVLLEGVLDTTVGLVGDSWAQRARVDPDAQLNVMSARAIEVVSLEEVVMNGEEEAAGPARRIDDELAWPRLDAAAWVSTSARLLSSSLESKRQQSASTATFSLATFLRHRSAETMTLFCCSTGS